ncbi:exported hypothetical protein [Sphingorhabdus sp. 109]|jgi:hypothetical protein|nr:exported hypothetical protein [Sphingorhabdus sp. 109]
MFLRHSILFAAMLSFGFPAHACSLEGGFDMHRFNPFQTMQSDPTDRFRNDARNQNTIGPVQLKTPVAKEPDNASQPTEQMVPVMSNINDQGATIEANPRQDGGLPADRTTFH